MNFETAFAHYQAHTATAEETALVERELEKYRLIEDYLAEQELPELPEDAAAAASAETKAVKRRLNRRTRNIVLISTAAVLAVVLLLQLVVSPLLNRRVYTDGLVDGSGYPEFDAGMSALAGLYMPLGDYYGSYAEHSGFMRDTLHLTFYDRTGSNRFHIQTQTGLSLGHVGQLNSGDLHAIGYMYSGFFYDNRNPGRNDERGLYVQSHLSENTNEIAWVRELHPDCTQYWETYNKYGMWKDHTLMAHCVHSDERERRAIKDAGVVVVHCADSNVNICSGICPVRQMVREGLWVTLGSDIAGGAQLPMYKVITMSIRTSKARRVTDEWHPDFLTVSEGYYLGTTAGHKYFGAGDGFAVGDRLHAVVIDDGDFPEAAHPLSVQERFERAIYMTHRHNIVSVWSDGREVVRR